MLGKSTTCWCEEKLIICIEQHTLKCLVILIQQQFCPRLVFPPRQKKMQGPLTVAENLKLLTESLTLNYMKEHINDNVLE